MDGPNAVEEETLERGEELKSRSFLCSFIHLSSTQYTGAVERLGPMLRPRSSWGDPLVKGQLQSHRIRGERESQALGTRQQLAQPQGRAGQGGEEGWELPRRGRRLGKGGGGENRGRGAWQKCLSAGLEEVCHPASHRKSPRQG